MGKVYLLKLGFNVTTIGFSVTKELICFILLQETFYIYGGFFSSIYVIHQLPIILRIIQMTIEKHFTTTSNFYLTSFHEINRELLTSGDILIIHINNPDINTLKSLKTLKTKGIKILPIIDSDNEEVIRYLLQQKFIGYLLNSFESGELVQALTNIQLNTPYLHPNLASLLFKEYLDEKCERIKPSNIPITRREWEVFQLVASGYSNDKIAKKLYLTESTVKNHVSSILHKLNVSDRTSAVVMAYKNKWFD
jgi:two-component system, NarL family, response regulator DegU